jgi:hypothetical protein
MRQGTTMNDGASTVQYSTAVSGSKQKDEVYQEKQTNPNKLLPLVTPSVQAGVIGPRYLTTSRRHRGEQRHESSTGGRTGASAISKARICKAIGRQSDDEVVLAKIEVETRVCSRPRPAGGYRSFGMGLAARFLTF